MLNDARCFEVAQHCVDRQVLHAQALSDVVDDPRAARWIVDERGDDRATGSRGVVQDRGRDRVPAGGGEVEAADRRRGPPRHVNEAGVGQCFRRLPHGGVAESRTVGTPAHGLPVEGDPLALLHGLPGDLDQQ